MRERLWVVPGLLAILAAIAAELLVRLDRLLDEENARPLWVFSGNADAARSVLSTIATATMTVLGVTLSITLAVLALTAQGYSPRALRRFVRDRVIQAVIGGFVGAFVFALVALRLVREDEVPGITVNVAVLLALAVLGLLVAFFHHMANEIHVERLIEAIWTEARAAIESTLRPLGSGDEGDDPSWPPPGSVVATARARRTGRVCRIDDDALADVARATGGTVAVLPGPGDLVSEGEAVARLHGGRAPEQTEIDRLCAAVGLGTRRTMTQDVAFGLRQLSDIALRALSPGVNDPTTAEEAILRSADLLRRLSDLRLGTRVVDADGVTLVVRTRPGWDELVGVAFDQCAAAAEGQADAATMRVLLDAVGRVLAATTAPDRREALRGRARRIRDGARRSLAEPSELRRVEAAAAALV